MITLIILIMMVGATKTAQSQNVSVAIFPINVSSVEKLQRLEILTSRKEVFTNYDEITKKIIFKMTNCNEIIRLYFPTYDKKGESTSCDCPLMTFYKRNGGWFTDEMPSDIREGFNKSEVAYHNKIIDRAIKSLGLFPEEIKKAEWLEDIRTNNIKVTFEADEK